MSDTSSPAKRALARQHLVEHAAERPDVGALVDGLAARLLGAHVRGRAEHHADAGHHRRADVIVGDAVASTLPDIGSSAFASPKSSTFTVPSGRTLMFAGFRSRWMMPCSCAASSASAICLAIGSASSSGIGPRAMRSARVGPFDQLHDERVRAVRLLEAVDRARCSDDSARRAPPPRAGSAQADRDRPRTTPAGP